MPDWSELRKEFESLREDLRESRIDFQWGAAGTHYRLAGAISSHSKRQFEILADIAGKKLSELPEDSLEQSVLHAEGPTCRWYEAIRSFGTFEFRSMGTQQDEAGNDCGKIYLGTIQAPAEVSALLCLHFSTMQRPSTEEVHSSWNRLNCFLMREAEARGYIWLVAVSIIGIALALLGLF